MRLTLHIAWYTIRDLTRNRWGLLYACFFAVVTTGLFHLQAQSAKVVVSLMSVCLFLIPLVSSLFGTIYLYNSREFIELVLTQPVSRRTVFIGMFAGLAAALVAGFTLGVGIPSVVFGPWTADRFLSCALLIAVGAALTVIFLALAFLLALRFDDRGKGLAAALGVWLFTALLYDGLVLLGTMIFADYPLEFPLLVVSMANPIDLARVILLTHTDWAALMGYTGAVFQRFFGTSLGLAAASFSLVAWVALPLVFGLRTFRLKDF